MENVASAQTISEKVSLEPKVKSRFLRKLLKQFRTSPQFLFCSLVLLSYVLVACSWLLRASS